MISNFLEAIGIDAKIKEFIEKRNLAVEELTQEQLATAFRQALECGDFVRVVRIGGDEQSVYYMPYRELESIRSRYNELIYAVQRRFEGETRHETALRYIKQAEEQASSGIANAEAKNP